MDHLAIVNKKRKIIKKILQKEKIIESRWYKTKRAPWNKINKNDTIYFKNSGEPVIIKAIVDKVIYFSDLNIEKLKYILNTYHKEIGFNKDKIKSCVDLYCDKKYCILVFLKNPKEIKPFQIDKTGFGLMSAWITINDINKIKIN